MTKEDWMPRMRTRVGLVKDFFWIAGVMTPCLMVMLYGVYALNKDWIVAELRAHLGVQELATKDDVARIEAAVEQVATLSRRNARLIELLSVPDTIVAYDTESSRALGSCSRTSGCQIELHFRRVPGAAACEIMPDFTVHEVISDEDGRARAATIIPGQVRNRNADLQVVEITVSRISVGTPIGPASYRITTQYENCPWQIEGQPAVAQASPLIPIIVVE